MEAYFQTTVRKVERPKRTFKTNRAQKKHMETLRELADQQNLK